MFKTSVMFRTSISNIIDCRWIIFFFFFKVQVIHYSYQTWIVGRDATITRGRSWIPWYHCCANRFCDHCGKQTTTTLLHFLQECQQTRSQTGTPTTVVGCREVIPFTCPVGAGSLTGNPVTTVTYSATYIQRYFLGKFEEVLVNVCPSGCSFQWDPNCLHLRMLFV